jgi:AAA family ATP:ADP antiporter
VRIPRLPLLVVTSLCRTVVVVQQMTGSNVKFKCKSWIDTFGQRGSKAGGSLITNAFATSIADLVK